MFFLFSFPFGLFPFSRSLFFFSLPCWFVLALVFSGKNLDLKEFSLWRFYGVEFAVCVDSGAVNVTNMEAIEEREITHRDTCSSRKCSLKTKGTMLSSVGEHVRTRMFQGFLLSFLLIDLPKVVATQVQE